MVSLFLIRFQEKNDVRYFVIPPLIKTYSKKSPDYANAEMDSAIVGGMRVADKLAEELVFNRRLKASFDALRATNYLSSVHEFSSAVQQGLDFLIQHGMISSKGYKKISELLQNFEV